MSLIFLCWLMVGWRFCHCSFKFSTSIIVVIVVCRRMYNIMQFEGLSPTLYLESHLSCTIWCNILSSMCMHVAAAADTLLWLTQFDISACHDPCSPSTAYQTCRLKHISLSSLLVSIVEGWLRAKMRAYTVSHVSSDAAWSGQFRRCTLPQPKSLLVR